MHGALGGARARKRLSAWGDARALPREVAIKLVLAEVADSVDYAERLRREARTMARVVHTNVIAVHDVGIFAGRPFIAMDFVAGADLRGHLRRTAPEWPAIVELFVQAARGLAAAHAVGVIHRHGVSPELRSDDRDERHRDLGSHVPRARSRGREVRLLADVLGRVVCP